MIYPKFLKENDTIGVTAPSDGVADSPRLNRLDNAIKSFQNENFKVIETRSVRKSNKGKSASSEIQAKELEELYKNKEVKAIFSVGGGEFLVEILPYIDFNIIKNNIKWIQGYSDPTSLLYIITTNLDIATIYSDNFCAFGMDPWHVSLKNNLKILKGETLTQTSFSKYETDKEYITGLEPYNLSKKVKWENLFGEEEIEISGRIIGGCLDVITELYGTRFDKTKDFIDRYKKDGIIWYFDNYDLSSEALIRTLWKLKDNGYFKYAKGIIFGRSIEKSYNNISLKEALSYALKDLNIPVIINTDIGHMGPRFTIINGAIASITCKNNKGSINFKLK